MLCSSDGVQCARNHHYDHHLRWKSFKMSLSYKTDVNSARHDESAAMIDDLIAINYLLVID